MQTLTCPSMTFGLVGGAWMHQTHACRRCICLPLASSCARSRRALRTTHAVQMAPSYSEDFRGEMSLHSSAPKTVVL